MAIKVVFKFNLYTAPKIIEDQVEEMEKKTDMIHSEMFSFNRKVTISGRLLVINIPDDLVKHMKIMKGNIVKIIPAGKKRFIVEI